MIKIENLSIGYLQKNHTKVVASDFNATLNGGELTCLIGANGVGKSTLLRTLSAFQPPLAGHIYVNGKELSRYTDKELARIIGVVLTKRPHITNMTVTEMIGLGRSPYTGFWGTLDSEDTKIVNEAIQLVGIEDLADRMIQTLSDGEKQKVMIAKALAQQTPVIYLDEPTAFLDYPSKVEVLQLLRRICSEAGKTVFLSTHDVELALQLADTVWLMTREQGVTIGSPQQLAREGVLARFIEREGITFNPETLAITVRKGN